MSLFQRPIGPPAILSDQAVERYLAAVRAELSLDPLFRRRLRGRVVNQFVAEREARTATGPRRRMGGLGRSVLYASFALSVSVASAMAASQGAAPGDALYALKTQIEYLRLQALPEHLHDDLAAHALGERIHELGILAERGDWARVATQADAVEAEYRHFVDTTDEDGSPDRYVLVLTALLDRLPDRAQAAIGDVLDGMQDAGDDLVRGQGKGRGQGQLAGSGAASDDSDTGGATGAGSDAGDPATIEPTPMTTRPERPERPEPTPRASKSPKPSGEPAASAPTEDVDEVEAADD